MEFYGPWPYTHRKLMYAGNRPRTQYYAQIFTYYAFEHCSKNSPIMLNIMIFNDL